MLRRRGALSLTAAALAARARPVRAGGRRIVVAGGGIAEIVHALGAREEIAAVDSTSQFPRTLRALPQIGYLRSLGAEGILALSPTLLLLAHEAGPPAVVAQLMQSGLRVVRAPRITGPETLIEAVRIVAAAIGRERAGEALAAAIEQDFDSLRAAVSALPRNPAAVFVLAVGGGAPQASGEGTAASAMLALAGARNVVTGYRGYRPIAAEALLAAGPEAVVTTTHTLDAVGGAAALARVPALALLEPVRAGRIIAFDSLFLLGFGPRTAHAARALAASLSPAVAIPSLPPRPWLGEAK